MKAVTAMAAAVKRVSSRDFLQADEKGKIAESQR
jgi:hypothetical protein